MTGRKTRVRTDAATVDAVPPYSLTLAWDPDDRIFVVTVPELPGCRTHGATYEAAAANAREAIALWVEVARDHGDPLPEPLVVRHPLDDDMPVVAEKVSA
jgi:predicted RNase H-like HicB family nuclease